MLTVRAHGRLPRGVARAAVAIAVLLTLPACRNGDAPRQPAAQPSPPVQPAANIETNALPRAFMQQAHTLDTAHYRILSNATPEQTRRIAEAVEALHRAYFKLFPQPAQREAQRLELVLYKDRDQFQRHNRSARWAEAYYRAPRGYAYFNATAANPHHWMLHEATHQLQREVSGFRRSRWLDEGLATYLSSSQLIDGQLQPGSPDPEAYPIWQLPWHRMSGVMQQDIANGTFIPLRALITGQGAPPVDDNVNAYYIHWWSLAHYLMHGDGGRHAAGYKRLVAEPGGVEAFERLVGPLAEVQRGWYADLVRHVRQAQAPLATRRR